MNKSETLFTIRNAAGIWFCYRNGVDAAIYSALSREEIIKRTVPLANALSPARITIHNTDGSTETKIYL